MSDHNIFKLEINNKNGFKKHLYLEIVKHTSKYHWLNRKTQWKFWNISNLKKPAF